MPELTRASFLTGVASALAAPPGSGAPPARVPLAVRNNRVYATFEVATPGGTRDPVEFNIDTGGGSVVIARRTANRLGLKLRPAAPASGAPRPFVPVELDAVYVAGVRIAFPGAFTTVADTDRFSPPGASPGFFPGAFLGDHAVTYDYLGGTLTLDGPPLDGGAELPVKIDEKSGFPRVELTIDGTAYGFLLDTGASFTMLSRAVVRLLHERHPDWPYRVGAYGPANMQGGPETGAAMMRLRDVRWGGIAVGDVDVVTRETGTFEQYMSRLTAGNIVGALGGNLLRNVAFRLDYAHSRLAVRYERRPRPDELTVVPLILQPREDGTFVVSGGAAADSLSGKQLISVDRRPVAGLTLDEVQQLLRGPVGTTRSIEVSGERPVDREIAAIL
ncbi:MAG TPA: aspartyl protease family protein [Candidatus Limnocylindrales bacterium]|nr:aspartyl protease family protein [Candidatus Limnocylindrales bacterium]